MTLVSSSFVSVFPGALPLYLQVAFGTPVFMSALCLARRAAGTASSLWERHTATPDPGGY